MDLNDENGKSESTPSPEELRGRAIISRATELFGGSVVLAPFDARSKRSSYKYLFMLTLDCMEKPEHIEALGRGRRNTAVVLGIVSNGLCALDFDDQQYADEFLECNPRFASTLTTTASRGMNKWFYMNGPIPESFDIRGEKGNIIEFRGNKRASLVFGIHPKGMEYRVLCSEKPIRINFDDIIWPRSWPPRKERRKLRSISAKAISKWSDEMRRIFDLHGPPAYVDKRGTARPNQVSIAKKFLIENPIKYFRGLGFYEYQSGTGIWEKTTPDTIKRKLSSDIAKLADSLSAENLKTYRTDRFLNEVTNIVKSEGEQIWVARGRQLIHFANGMLYMNENPIILRPHSPDALSFARIPYDYNPSAECPRFLEFLHWALPENDVKLLQKWAGMALLGENFAQAILMIVGVAGAGKGVVTSIITQIIGLKNCEQLRTIHLENRFEIARYFEKSLLVGSDVRGDFLNLNGAQALKSLTGGDPITAERKGQNESIQMRGKFNVVVTSNRRLRINLDGDQDAWARRIKVLEFTRKAEKQDPEFAEKIVAAEASGILNWMLEGLFELREDYKVHGSWQLHDNQKKRIENLILESNALLTFVNQEVELGNAQSSVTTRELRIAYERFCSDRNWTPLNQNAVDRGLPDILEDKFAVKRRNDILRRGTSQRGYSGIRLINGAREENDGFAGDLF